MTQHNAPADPAPGPETERGRSGASAGGRAGTLRARLWLPLRRAGLALGAFGGRRVPPRRIGKWLLTALLVVLPSVVWGVATASAQGSLGPHTARYEVTLDGEVTVDLGPFGALVIDSPLPLELGARVVVQEIPEDVTAIESAKTLESFASTLEQYVAFFTGPEATVRLAARALVEDAIRRSVLAGLALTLGLLAGRALLGAPRRAELAERVAVHRNALVGAVVVAGLVGTGVTASGLLPPGPAETVRASSVFDGTPLEGARITGRLAGVVDTYGGYAVDAWRANERFYEAAEAAVREEWADRMAADQRLADLRAAATMPISPSPEPTDDPGEPDDDGEPADDSGPTDGRPTETPEETVEPTEDSELVTLLVVSDLHCNIGMARVIGAVAELSAADVVLNAGDTTGNGTVVESYCVQAFQDGLPSDVRTLVVNGNHDSVDTAQQERSAGWTVLEGEVVEVAGVRALGDADPRATRIGSGTFLIGDETVEDLGTRLADTACGDEDGVDILLVHDPAAGAPTLIAGCAPAQVSGHYHRRIGPLRVGQGARYVSSSTAGARLGQATIGPLSGTAELTVLRFDPEARQMVDYRLILVHPDATVTVGAPLSWPHQSPRLTPDTPYR